MLMTEARSGVADDARPASGGVRLAFARSAAPESPPPPGEAYADDVVQRVRRLVEKTTLPLREIAALEGPSKTTILKWSRDNGWLRPPVPGGLPHRAMADEDLVAMREDMVLRLHRTLARQLNAIERRTGEPEAAEKDARALAVLAKTYETLTALGHEGERSQKEPELPNRDDVTARLAETIARWAEGGPAG